MATDYSINYEDDRFKQVESQKQSKLAETNSLYNEMTANSDKYYQAQIDASKDWANKQTELQQANTDFAIEQINQQKEQANKDYQKEQKGAYTDYQKEINAYGTNAEQMATSGLQNSGYSESSRVNLFTSYQNRYATAKDSYNRAVLNYDNSIKEAQLANNSKLAEISYQALQSQLQLALEGFQYKNTLLLQQAEAVNKVEDTYYNRYQNVLQQINTENSLAEQVRQYNEKMAEEKRQYNESLAFQKSEAAREQANWQKQYDLSLQQYNASQAKSSGSSSSGSSSSTSKVSKASTSTPSVKSNTTSSTSTNLKTQNALNTFVNAAPNKMGTTYTTAAAAAKAKGVTSPYSESYLIKNGIVKKITAGGKTYYQ